jgi:shikimate dehydrogenase
MNLMASPSPDRYAVIGRPIGHTKSPQIHRRFAEVTGENIVYEAIEGAEGGIASQVTSFIRDGGRGMNVTVPFKLEAFALADESTPSAKLAGAVNCLKFEDGRVLADNFDGVGLVIDIQQNLGISLAGKRLLVLGAGGAARGLLLPFLAQRPAEFVLVNRNPSKAFELIAGLDIAATAGIDVRGGGPEEIGQGHFDVVVNATSSSLQGLLPPIAATVFSPGGLAYDLLYGQGLTPFLRLAAESGVATYVDGVGMLVEQAAEAFHWWRGVRPSTRAVIDELTVPLA